MNLVIVYNPIAGAGRAKKAGRRLAEYLRRHHHEVRLLETSTGPAREWLVPRLTDVDVLIVAGGDGTVRLAAPAAIDTDTPIHHYPLGTENLFAREFGMASDEGRLLKALRERRIHHVDIGLANGEIFLLMVSVGLDAEVIHDLHGRRNGSISHLSYVGPIVRQFLRYKPHHLEVTVDGRRIDGEQPGFVVVANCRQYARRLDPAREAVIDDGVLDAVFFPAKSRLQLLAWAWRCHRGTQLRHPKVITRRGSAITVGGVPARLYQVDGDVPHPESGPYKGPGAGPAPGTGAAAETRRLMTPIDVRIKPGALPVLLPPA